LISVPSPVPGKYFIMAENGVGGRALDAFLHEIVYADDAFATGAVPADAFQRAEAAAASVPAGSGGVLYFPWLNGSGAPYHDDHMRGGFVNVSLTTTRAHLTRGVLEGVALNAAALLPHVASHAGADYDEVSMGGGGASSDLWAAIMADTFGIAVHQLEGARTTNARGAAFLALAQLGRITLDDVPDLLRVHRTHRPDPERHAVYRPLLDRFLDFHERNRPFYASLNPHQEATS
jgi:xylulokinase